MFYFGIVADITPPVALAAYAGSAIAKSDPMKTGINATKLAIAAFIVPYIFAYSPALLFENISGWWEVAQICISALLGIFAIGAPGVPGGTVMASLGLITGVLMFDDAGTALMLAIFALQDSFGTACNITGDGALTLILTGYADRHKIAVAESTAEE